MVKAGYMRVSFYLSVSLWAGSSGWRADMDGELARRNKDASISLLTHQHHHGGAWKIKGESTPQRVSI